jgi:hypothetical protein
MSDQLARDMLAAGRILPSGLSPDGRRILNWSHTTPPPAPVKASAPQKTVVKNLEQDFASALKFDSVAEFAKSQGRTYIPSSPKV